VALCKFSVILPLSFPLCKDSAGDARMCNAMVWSTNEIQSKWCLANETRREDACWGEALRETP